MTCLNKTYPYVATVPAPIRRPGFIKAMIVLIGAFAEALDMMHAAQRRYRLYDE
jgi:hypothetical protein